MFLRAIYSLGESADSATVMFRSTSRDGGSSSNQSLDDSDHRNSLAGPGSLQWRADVGATQHTESDVDDETGAISQPAISANSTFVREDIAPMIAKNSMPLSGIIVPCDNNEDTRSFSESSPEAFHATQSSSLKSGLGDVTGPTDQDLSELLVEGRSVCPGAVRTHLPDIKDFVADEPPARRQDNSPMDCCGLASTEDDHLKGQSDIALLEDSLPSSGVLHPKQDVASFHRTRKLLGHKR